MRAAFAALMFLWFVAACDEEGTPAENTSMEPRPIEVVLEEHTPRLMAISGVNGTGLGLCNGRPCIKVFVIEKTPALEAQIPSLLEGHEVAIEETGEFRPRIP